MTKDLTDILADIMTSATGEGATVQGFAAPMQDMEAMLGAVLTEHPEVAAQLAPLLQQTRDMNALMDQMALAEAAGDSEQLLALSQQYAAIANVPGAEPETDPQCLALEVALDEANDTGDNRPLAHALDGIGELNITVGQFDLTPLTMMLTSEGRSLDRLELFLERGARVNMQADGAYSPLHAMVDYIDSEDPDVTSIAARLVDAGADTEARDAYGWTPLLRACVEGSPAEMCALLEAGSDADAVCPAGAPCGTGNRPALLVAASKPEKVICLLEHGATADPDMLAAIAAELATETEDGFAAYFRGLEASRELIRQALPH